jgi:predicted homoserine dehydrogenase-like protein
MRISWFAVGLVVAAIAGTAMAQSQNPPAQSGPQNSAVNPSQQRVDAPVRGSNSFTEGEAKSRIEAKGFANVSGLQKDNDGVWRGHATRDGKQVEVSLDYQGNVVAR